MQTHAHTQTHTKMSIFYEWKGQWKTKPCFIRTIEEQILLLIKGLKGCFTFSIFRVCFSGFNIICPIFIFSLPRYNQNPWGPPLTSTAPSSNYNSQPSLHLVVVMWLMGHERKWYVHLWITSLERKLLTFTSHSPFLKSGRSNNLGANLHSEMKSRPSYLP